MMHTIFYGCLGQPDSAGIRQSLAEGEVRSLTVCCVSLTKAGIDSLGQRSSDLKAKSELVCKL